jgi:hypothetical protein
LAHSRKTFSMLWQDSKDSDCNECQAGQGISRGKDVEHSVCTRGFLESRMQLAQCFQVHYRFSRWNDWSRRINMRCTHCWTADVLCLELMFRRACHTLTMVCASDHGKTPLGILCNLCQSGWCSCMIVSCLKNNCIALQAYLASTPTVCTPPLVMAKHGV